METSKFKRPIRETVIDTIYVNCFIEFFNKHPDYMEIFLREKGVAVGVGDVLNMEEDYTYYEEVSKIIVFRTREENTKEREMRLDRLRIEREAKKAKKIRSEEYDRRIYEQLRKRFE